jgi:hypothetical protein
LTSNLSSYLPLAGGTMTGPLILNNTTLSTYGLRVNNTTGAAGFVASLEADNSYTLAIATSSTTNVTIRSNNDPSFINTTGNFGFGNLSPSYRVDITGTLRSTAASYFATSSGNVLIGTTTDNGNKLQINGTGYFSGNVGIGRISPSNKLSVINSGASQGTSLFSTDNATNNSIEVYASGADGYNAAATVMILGKNSITNRSINAGGTLNALGTDYAEYMTKSIEDNIAKGDVVGVDKNGLLTNIFMDAKSFVVKSTNPSFIGGDNWSSVDNIGKISNNSTDKEKKEYQAKIEEARSKVDRIAFSGQVPCNVYDANVGDYIIPINDNGKIKGQAITNPTFEQYQISVGKVWKIMKNGKAWIAIKIG